MTLLDYLSVARFTGPDAADFLHAQLSADIAVLESGEATFACYCNPRGQVIGLLLVCRQNDEYLVAAATELLPRILTRLKMFVFRSRVESTGDTEIAVYGSGQQEDSSGRCLFQPPGADLHYRFLENHSGDDGSAEHFKAREIRNQVSWLGPETSEKFIPQMLGFEQLGAVSFGKGCYPGQEIVARTRYLGKVKRTPVIVQTEKELMISPADRVELRRENAWSKGTMIDSAPANGAGTLFFIVAPREPESGPDRLKHQDQSYRCATT
jgi:folate-binding protein YgfZ